MKKSLSMAVVLCLLVSLFSGLTISVSAAGDGTEGNPYQIATVADLALVAEYPDAYFVQTANLTGVNSSITDASKTFTGSYDGGNYSIAVSLTNSQGLFAVTSGATIKNLTVTGTVGVNASGLAGAIAGTINSTAFENCINKTTITGKGTKTGGIAGSNNSGTSTFTGCRNEGSITIDNYFIGGILGYSADAASVTFVNCANTGDVKGSTYVVGGILGQGNATMTNCYNTGSVMASYAANRMGGLVGGVLGTVALTNCYNTGTITQASGGSGALVGGTWKTATTTLTNCYNIGTVGTPAADQDLIASYLQSGSTHTKNYVNCYTTGTSTAENVTGGLTETGITVEKLNEGAATGYEPYQTSKFYSHPVLVANPEPAPALGSEENPYQIATKADLALVAANPAAYFEQTANIEEEVTSPINGSATFTGNYDGKGYSIKVKIESDAQSVGLFTKVAGTVSNVTVKGSVKGNDRAGGVVGELQQSGAIINCVNYAAVSGWQGIAGILGCSTTGVNGNSVQNCKNFGTITATGQYIGGIVGYGLLGSLSGCANYGDVTGGGPQVGGIVGYNNCNISNCLNAGNVTCNGNLAGGISGQFRATSISNCYNLGTVTAKGNNAIAGGLTTGNFGNVTFTVKNCYNAGAVLAPNGTAANMAISSSATNTCTYDNCYALTTETAGAPAGVTYVDPAALKTADLGSAFSITGDNYAYPQLTANPIETAWDFGKLTVTCGENGTTSFTGSIYLKKGSVYQLAVTPAANYVVVPVDLYVVQNGYMGIQVGDDTVVNVTFRKQLPSFVMAPQLWTIDDELKDVFFVKIGEGAYTASEFGIEYSKDGDTYLPLRAVEGDAAQFGILLDFSALNELPEYTVRAYVKYLDDDGVSQTITGESQAIRQE